MSVLLAKLVSLLRSNETIPRKRNNELKLAPLVFFEKQQEMNLPLPRIVIEVVNRTRNKFKPVMYLKAKGKRSKTSKTLLT